MAPLLRRELEDSPHVLALVSDAVRAEQTWELVESGLGHTVRSETAPDIYEAEVDAITSRIHASDSADAVIVGSAVKQEGDWRRPLDPTATKRLAEAFLGAKGKRP